MYDFISSVVVLILFMSLLAITLKRFTIHEQKFILAGFFFKVVATLAQIWIHLYIYGYGDMLSYFNYGVSNAELMRHDFFHYAPEIIKVLFHQEPDVVFNMSGVGWSTGTLGAIASILAFITGGSLYASCLIVSMGAYWGLIALYSAFPPAVSLTYQRRLLVSCLMIPSVVFWSSGIIKESIALTGVGLATYGIFKFFNKKNMVFSALIFIVGVTSIALTKAYLLGPLVLAGGAWFYFTRNQKSTQSTKTVHLLIALGFSLIALVAIGKLFPRYALDNLAEQISRQQTIGQSQDAGSSSSLFDSTDASTVTQLRNLPVATFSVLFRPFIFEAHNILAFVNALETTLIAIIFFIIIRRRTFRECWHNLFNSPMLVYCFVFTVVCAVGVGLTTVNLGTLSRYRMPMMPFYMILLSALLPVKRNHSMPVVPSPRAPESPLAPNARPSAANGLPGQ